MGRFDVTLYSDGMYKTFPVLGIFGRKFTRERSYYFSRYFDCAFHFSFCKAGVGADTVYRQFSAIGREGFVFHASGTFAVNSIPRKRAELFYIELINAPANFL